MSTLGLGQITLEQLTRLTPLEAHPLTTVPWEAFEATATDLVGVADGVLAREGGLGGEPKPPLLLVVEAKRAVDATDPAPRLLGALYIALRVGPAAAATTRVSFGCYTVGDTWTFARATLTDVDAAPRVVVDWSREYTERNEAGAILRILSAIVRGDLAS